MVCKIVGIRETLKEGNRSFTVYYTEPFEDWESGENNTVHGEKCGNEWTNRVDCGFLKPGDMVEFTYAKGFQGKAVLAGINVVKPKTDK